MKAGELRILRAQTYQFIGENPSRIVLVPQEKVSDGAGGFTYEDRTPRPEQEGRLIKQVNGRAVRRDGLDGRSLDVEFVLMMPWGSQIGLYDRLVGAGALWEVVHIRDRNDYQVKAELGLVRRNA